MLFLKRYLVITLLVLGGLRQASANDDIVYIGSYTDAPSTSKGIYAWRIGQGPIDPKPLGLVAETVNPAYIAVAPSGNNLYAVNWQTAGAKVSDTVSAYRIGGRSGELTLLNRVPSGGGLPNALTIDPKGRVAVVVNYGFHGASVAQNNSSAAALSIGADGRLGEPFYVDHHAQQDGLSKRSGAHTHGVVFSHDGRFAFVAELGLDRIYSYRFDSAAPKMAPFDPPFITMATGSGPRRMALSPSGKCLYVNRQNDSKVSVFRVEGGAITEIQSVTTIPSGFSGHNATAEIKLDNAGKFLYVSNRGNDSIAVFAVDPVAGTLTQKGIFPSLGKSPRNMSFDPSGRYLFVANQESDNVVIFGVDSQNGALAPTGRTLSLSQPAGIAFVKARD